MQWTRSTTIQRMAPPAAPVMGQTVARIEAGTGSFGVDATSVKTCPAPGRAVEARILCVAGGGSLVVPRVVRVDLLEGPGVAHVEGTTVDPAWRQAMLRAWAAAVRLVGGSGGRRPCVRISAGPPLRGTSAGATLALLCLLGLLDARPESAFVATGDVEATRGHLRGGAWMGSKARAAAALRGPEGPWRPIFIGPPRAGAPGPGVRHCADLASALHLLAPDAYDLVRPRHLQMAREDRHAGQGPWIEAVCRSSQPLPAAPPGVAVHRTSSRREQVLLRMGQDGMCLWSTLASVDTLQREGWGPYQTAVDHAHQALRLREQT